MQRRNRGGNRSRSRSRSRIRIRNRFVQGWEEGWLGLVHHAAWHTMRQGLLAARSKINQIFHAHRFNCPVFRSDRIVGAVTANSLTHAEIL